MPKSRKRATAARGKAVPVQPFGGGLPLLPGLADSFRLPGVRHSPLTVNRETTAVLSLPVSGRSSHDYLKDAPPALVVRVPPVANRLAAPAVATISQAPPSLTAVPSVNCAALNEAAKNAPALGATYYVEATEGLLDEPFELTVTFAGVRVGAETSTDEKDRFQVAETVENVSPRSGRTTVSGKVNGINAGTWKVTAVPDVRPAPGAHPTTRQLPTQSYVVDTRLEPFVRGPGVFPFAWPILVLLGVIAAILVQVALAGRYRLPTDLLVTASLLGTAAGYVTAKAYYMVQHRHRNFVSAGTCIQGFLLGAFATSTAIVAFAGVSPLTYLDVAAPGILFAMAIGRPGCWLGGCCAGRTTTSRWGMWSSNRRVGTRRVPSQLLEAFLALTLGAVALWVDLSGASPSRGTTFVGAMAAYTAGRQLLFPLREERRNTATGRTWVLLASLLVLAAVIANALFRV